MTSNGVMVIVTATPLIMADIKAMSQLFGLNHWGGERDEVNVS